MTLPKPGARGVLNGAGTLVTRERDARTRLRWLLLNHFRGNLDNWDPTLADALAGARRVNAFDNTGV